MGVYSDAIILVPLNSTVVTLASLSFFFAFLDGEGTFSPEFSIWSPSTQPVLIKAKLPKSIKEFGKAMNINVNIAPFQIKEFGKFKVEMTLDEWTFARTFEIRKDASIVEG